MCVIVPVYIVRRTGKLVLNLIHKFLGKWCKDIKKIEKYELPSPLSKKFMNQIKKNARIP